MQWDFSHANYIPRQSCLPSLFGCGRDRKYWKMIEKANVSVARELDLIKFIQRQRLTTFTTLCSFNGRQKFIADKMSTKLIRESSDLNEGTEDDFELDQENVQDIE